jgi:hypothetical protein
MKSDKPFQKGLICGCVLFAIVWLLILVLVRRQELYFVKYFRICIVSFLPTVLTAIWCFFSKKNWNWLRFIIVTVILCPLGLALLIFVEDFLPEERQALPTITFSPAISSSWTVEIGRPIVDMKGKPIGNQLRLTNDDNRREIWVEAHNSYNDFGSNVDDWKLLMTSRSKASGFHLLQHNFRVDTKSGHKVATLQLLVQKDNLEREIICEGWMQKQFFITCEAMGENVKIANDTEISNIISGIVVR